MSTAAPAPLLTADQVGEALGIHVQTVRKFTRRGVLPFAVNVGTELMPRWRYDTKGLARWVESRRTTAA